MVFNDDEGHLNELGAPTTIASRLAPTEKPLHPPILSHRQRISIADDEMVEHPHIN
ncbi:hypothetical protein SAMN05216558_5250 [Pseudomonas vancouverensis]|nr:hypothetical protein SAMN05216558_5250 [Pseudomonas vancouverensis]